MIESKGDPGGHGPQTTTESDSRQPVESKPRRKRRRSPSDVRRAERRALDRAIVEKAKKRQNLRAAGEDVGNLTEALNGREHFSRPEGLYAERRRLGGPDTLEGEFYGHSSSIITTHKPGLANEPETDVGHGVSAEVRDENGAVAR